MNSARSLMLGRVTQRAARRETGIGIEDGRKCFSRGISARRASPAISRRVTPLSSRSGRSATPKCWKAGGASSSAWGRPTQVWMPCRRWPAARSASPVALAVGDAAARRHPVDVAGIDFLHAAQRVAVHLRPVEQIGDGGQSNMGMRPHIDALARREIHRAEIVEEDKGPDAAPRNLRQQAGDERSRSPRSWAFLSDRGSWARA